MIRRLEDGRPRHRAPEPVDLDLIDPFDVGRATPTGHQRRRRRAAVLVAPHDRVLQEPMARGRGRSVFVPCDERRVGDRVLVRAGLVRVDPDAVAAVQHGRMRQRDVGAGTRRNRAEVSPANVHHVGRRRGRFGIEMQRQHVPSCSLRSEIEAAGDRCRRHHDVVGDVDAVDRESEDGRLGTLDLPRDAGSRRGHVDDHLAGSERAESRRDVATVAGYDTASGATGAGRPCGSDGRHRQARGNEQDQRAPVADVNNHGVHHVPRGVMPAAT